MHAGSISRTRVGMGCLLAITVPLALGMADEQTAAPKAFLDGTGPGWTALGEEDFVSVNCDPETWTWKDGMLHCRGRPVGVTPHDKPVDQLRAGGRVAAPPIRRQFGDLRLGSEKALKGLKPNSLPRGGIEVQSARPRLQGPVREELGQESHLVHDQRRRLRGRHVEDEAVPAASRPTAAAASPARTEQGGRRVEPLLRPGINGEVRLWVNGEEVSGGSGCEPLGNRPSSNTRT